MLSPPERLSFNFPNFGQPQATHRLVAYQWGNAGEAVLCVHGLTRNGRDFDFLAEKLLPDFRVVAPDMPGRGQSDWLSDTKGYSYPSYVAEIAQLLAALNLRRVHWVGTSMGGIIGMMMANAVPGLIESLVLNDIGCVVAAEGLKRIVSAPGGRDFNTCEQAEAALRERLASFCIKDNAHWQHLFMHGILDDGRFRLAYDPAIIAGLPKETDIKDIDLWPLWEAVKTIPVLLIRGAESDILRRDTAQAMQAQHPRLTLKEIPGCGHAPALMDEAQTTLIADWIAKK